MASENPAGVVADAPPLNEPLAKNRSVGEGEAGAGAPAKPKVDEKQQAFIGQCRAEIEAHALAGLRQLGAGPAPAAVVADALQNVVNTLLQVMVRGPEAIEVKEPEVYPADGG